MTTELDRTHLKKFLDGQNVAVISTVNSVGLPDAAPIFFLCREDMSFQFVTPVETSKAMNIVGKPNVVLTITDEANRETVRVNGIAVEQKDALTEVLFLLAKKLNGDDHVLMTLPLLKHTGQAKTVYHILPSSIVFRKYHNHGMSEEKFEFTKSAIVTG